MMKPLLLCSAMLFVTGCDRFPSEPDSLPSGVLEQVVIIDRFNEDNTVIVTQQGIRVGSYYDFSQYDSVRINFTAERLDTTKPFDYIRLRIGPMTTFTDSLARPQRDFSILINPARVSKARYAAVKFYVNEADVVLRLSNLRIVGWYTH